MKFSCDRCGKKYATAEAPAPGRVYKLKCKACGHLIVVKTPPAGAAATPVPAEEPRAPSMPAAPAPEVDLEVEPPLAPPPPSLQTPAGTPIPTRAAEPTAEISMLTGENAKPQEGGYVDIFADSAPPPEPPPASDDPFLKAARGSLPEHFTGAAPMSDPFADMRDELDRAAPPAAPSPHEAPSPAPPPAEFAPPPPRPQEKKKSGLPVALIGVGVAAVVGIVVVVALTSGKKPEPAPGPAPAPVAAPTPAPPPPAPAPVPEPVPESKKAEAAKAEPVAARKDDKKDEQARLDAERRREEARQEADRKRAEADRKREEADRKRAEADRKREEARQDAERKRAEARQEADRKREQARLDAERKREEDRRREEERKAEEERKRLARAEASKPVQLPDAASALSPEAVQRVVSGSRRAFEACIVEAARKGTDTKFDGRKVALRLNVNPNGFVTYPTLDDVTLNRTELGECLKAAARLMVFPKFQGDVFHVEVPLTLRGG